MWQESILYVNIVFALRSECDPGNRLGTWLAHEGTYEPSRRGVGGSVGLSYEKIGDVRRKIWIKPLLHPRKIPLKT